MSFTAARAGSDVPASVFLPTLPVTVAFPLAGGASTLQMSLGPYRLERELGAGGMGKVYAATVVGRALRFAEGAIVALEVVHMRLLETPGHPGIAAAAKAAGL